ncbi:hypothetical protein HanXRQr2_Chr01g0012081 [Helianthus annuus]|uniref:Uncharacterized protein n=1 Tax=Helianthus annuus TaxID=4232 RepID=A0A9K3P2D5_HELAN|nr:hypothetical protein HanXRQr2_Chr01g0012081 [Helianthus annuus]KAJ0621861.1 hypothetical protein HanIR_Chr01g0013481 [Helianthus annuus]
MLPSPSASISLIITVSSSSVTGSDPPIRLNNVFSSDLVILPSLSASRIRNAWSSSYCTSPEKDKSSEEVDLS